MIDMSCDLLTDVVMMSANSKCPSRQGILDCQTSACMLVYIRDQRTCAPVFHQMRIYVWGFQVCWLPIGIDWLLIKDPIERAKRYLHMESNANHHNRSASISQQFHQAISRESLFESEFHFEPKIIWKLPYLESRLTAKMTLFRPHGNLRFYQRLLYFDDYPVSGS